MDQRYLVVVVDYQTPVVQTLDSAIERINSIQWISIRKTYCAIQWIVIYPVDSVIFLSNNWDLVFFYYLFYSFFLNFNKPQIQYFPIFPKF